MYEIRPRNVYIHERVLRTSEWGRMPQACSRRMERMMACIHPDETPEVVDDARLNAISRERRWERVKTWRTGQYKRERDPDIIFNAYRWAGPEEMAAVNEHFPHLAFARLNGHGMVGYRDGRSLLEKRHGVCQNAYDLHSAWGCLHACDYCNIGEFLNIVLNLEEMVERLDGLLDANPWLQLYKYDNQTDTITFEPEYGASELLVPYFAQRENEYLMLYTKSANVEHLLDLEHRGHTIVCWSISCETVSREIEKNCPTTAERIEAARQCQEAGYAVRARFSPIVPIKNWRAENAAMIEQFLSAVEPDVVTMDVLGLLGYHRLVECLDVSLLDDRYVEMARELYSGEPPERPYWPVGKQMFPHEARAEVYRFFIERMRQVDADVPISLCDETPEMWEELAGELAGTPAEYVCACGPTSVPGNPLLRSGPGRRTRRRGRPLRP
jgi:DNA repair photolyase